MSLVSPRAGTSVTFDLAIDPDVAFNVAGAVSDPDGDAIYYYWYLLHDEDEEGVAPTSSLGPTFFLRPCSRLDELAPGPADGGLTLRYLQLDIGDGPRLPEEQSEGEPRSYGDDVNVVTLTWVLVLRGTCP